MRRGVVELHNPFADVDSITAGWRVTYVYVDEMPAIAAASDEDGVRMILLNRADLEKIKDEVLRATIERGARVHEGAEIVYGEIPKRNQAQKDRKSQGLNVSFWHHLDNVLGDVYIEARIEKQFPVFAKYLSFLLWHAQELVIQGQTLKIEPESDMEKAIKDMMKKMGIEVNPGLIKTVHALWFAVRLGEIPKELLDDSVIADMQFIVPRVFLARRGKQIDGVVQGSDEIYHYLDKKYGIPPEITIEIRSCLKGRGSKSEGGSGGSGLGIKVRDKSGSSKSGKGDGESGDKDKDGSSGGGKDKDKDKDDGAGGGKGKDKDKEKDGGSVNVLPWKNREQVEQDAKDAQDETADKLDQMNRQGDVGGLLGGPDHAKLTPPTVKDAQFYSATIRKHENTIRRLQALFKSLAGKRGFVPTREGDLILHPSILQAAYTDSFRTIGEDEQDYYQVLRYDIPDIDLVMVIDQSGCVHPSTQVPLADGNIVSIGDAYAQQIKDDALTFDFSTGKFCARPIARMFRYTAPSHLFEVNTLLTSGLFTKEHRFFALNPASLQLEEKFVSQLRTGDRVLVPATLATSGESQALPRPRGFAYAYKHKGWRMPRIPETLTPAFAQILGYLTGDGGAADRMVYATDKDEPTLRIYQDFVTKVLKIPSEVKMRGGRLRLLVNNAVFASYLKTHFPQSVTNSQKRTISPMVLKSPLRAVATFLRGEFDAEGNVAHHSLRFFTTSSILSVQVQLTLMRFGIASTRSASITPERKIHDRTVKKTRIFCVSISDPASIATFARHIGFSHPTKQAKLQQMLRQRSNSERRSNLTTLPLADAIRHTMSLVAFSSAERRRFKLGQCLVQAAGMRPTKRYLHCLDAKIAQAQNLPIANADLIQLTDACRLLHVRFNELTKLTGISARRFIGRIYTVRHEINHGSLAKHRAHALAEIIRPLVLKRKLEVVHELSKQRDALREILRHVEAGTIRLVKVKSVRRRKANTDFVYDWEIAENHNYIANGAVTHNSTYGTAEVFSEATICITEAVRRVGKIRSAAVSLGDGLRILKDFWEPVEAGRFAPQSGGGTPLGEAIDQALKFKWRRGATVRRVVVLLTDGYPDDWRKVDRPIAEVKQMRIIPIAFCVGMEANADFKKRFEEVFDIKDAEGLTEAFLKTFLEKAVLKIGRRR